MKTLKDAIEDTNPVVLLAMYNLNQVDGLTRKLTIAEKNILSRSITTLRDLGYRVSVISTPSHGVEVIWVR